MRKKTKILSLLIIIFSVGSCGILFENVKFTKPEMKWFNVYKKQDTLIFQSLDSKIRDTTIITSKRIYHEYVIFWQNKLSLNASRIADVELVLTI